MGNENVVTLDSKRNGPIFNAELKKQIAADIEQHTEMPELVVQKTEDAICRYIVTVVGTIAEKLGKSIANKIINFVEGK